MTLQYLFDENIELAYVNQIRRRQPDLLVLAVGDLTAPKHGPLDPEILIWCETRQFVLVTNDLD